MHMQRRLFCTAAALGAALTLPGVALAQRGPQAQDEQKRGGEQGQARGNRGDRGNRSDRSDRGDRGDRGDRYSRGSEPQRRPQQQQARPAPQANTRPPVHSQAPQRGIGPGHNLHRGDRLPAAYRHHHYVVNDWRGHHLSAPPRGHQWVQIGGDYALIAIATGVITALVLASN